MPEFLKDMVVDRIVPRTEVIVAEDSQEDPEIKKVACEIRRLLKNPSTVTVRGRNIELAVDDVFRAYLCVTEGIEENLEFSSGDPRPVSRAIGAILQEAQDILDAIADRWIQEVLGKVVSQICDLIDRTFRVDGRMIDVQHTIAKKPEGRDYRRLEIRLRNANQHVVSYQGSQRTTFACFRSHGMFGLHHVTWDCQRLGICGPNRVLPVYIGEHAIKRLHERLPLRGHGPLLHRLMTEALENPVVISLDDENSLVELCLGSQRVGYFVAQVLPHMVLIKTYLFLTMQGTPEAAKLREKLGLYRADIEHYKLDKFFTLVASDIVGDPLLVRILSECGCGHLVSLIDPANRVEWLDRVGNHFKKTFELREWQNGFVANQKWTKWSV